MAAHLFFFASLEARSFIFPCCNQSLFCRFPFPPLPFHTLRLSAVNPKFSPKFVSKSSFSNSDSVSGDLDILSTTECSDGSIIFRFGDEREMEINKADQSQATNESAKIVVKVGDQDLGKEDISSINEVDVSDGEPEAAEPVSKKVGHSLKVKSQPKRKSRRNTTKLVDVVGEKVASVIIGNDTELEKKSVDPSKNIHPKDGYVELDNVVKVQHDNAPEGNVESIRKTEGTTNLNMVLKEDIVPDLKRVSPPLAASAVESEILTQLASSESGSKIEVPHGVKLQEENSDSSEGHCENFGKIQGNALNMVLKMNLAPEIEKVSPPLAASAVESETTTELASLESGFESDVPHGVKSQEDNSGASDGNGKSVDKIEDATLNMESKMDLAVEEVRAQVAASEREITTQSTSLGACSNIEVPHSLKFQERGKDNAGKEVAHLSMPSKEHSEELSINASKMLVIIEDASVGDVSEVKLNSTLSEVESTLNEATVHKTVDESVDNDLLKSSKLSDEGVPFSYFKEEITEVDAQSGNKVRAPMLKGVELQSGGTTLEREEVSTAGFFLYSGAALLPNPKKAFAGGENAYFIACQKWLGVADGVGHWSLEGMSVGLYAKELMENCEKIVSDRNGVPITDPEEILNKAAANTQSYGSSTVLVASFDDQALHVASIGDSGFMVIRNGTVFKRSSRMVYEFNFPIQIERGDHPSDFVEEIAELLATKAQEVGQLSSVRSPFADEAQAAGYVGYRGGKLDDVTVIVSLVKRRFSNHELSHRWPFLWGVDCYGLMSSTSRLLRMQLLNIGCPSTKGISTTSVTLAPSIIEIQAYGD
ncbi:probable protein phosphatase 2C 62 isoform X3 [Durio zibethinus]|uniref:Probable protein phosphatase 2C 62 isoform X3 n=1 Tax=Durio zibethinus TaxID=66656 RepID=A0A6P6AFZ9_DURZI|nr:probable protein phosphatase 2C 62 isoform X3 [Durio zibethinus]